MNAVEAAIASVLPDIFSDAEPSNVVLPSDALPTVAEGGRNDHLASLAGYMRRRGMTRSAILAALLEENRQRCRPPLDDDEVRAIASSIGRYAPPAVERLDDGLADAVDVADEGRTIVAVGVRYLVKGLVPNYGMLGMTIAYAKVGKTTFGHALGAAVATGSAFLDRQVEQARVLVLAVEDPPEYTAWLARHLAVPRGAMTFYRRPIRFDEAGLAAVTRTVREGRYGLVLVSSWQAVISGVVRDENDNAGAAAVVEAVKLAARQTGVPWLIDAHAGKGEDQLADADPTRAMRGASAAAGAVDFLLSLRYADGPFTSRRRLNGKGRFVYFAPLLLDYDVTAGTFTTISDGRSVVTETTWNQIVMAGVLRDWASVDAVAMAIGLTSDAGRVTGAGRRRVKEALRGRPLDSKIERKRGQQTTLYRFPGGDVV